KDEILWLYLNQIYLGRGAYGVASAAWRYFGKTLDELTLAECAMLAGLPKAPTSYAPHAHPKKALARRNTVLRLMHEAGFISEEEMKKAMREPLVVRPLFQNTLIGAYENRVYEELVRRFGANAVRRGGLVVIVPYRAEAQRAAQEAVRRGILAIEERTPYRYPERVSPEAIETKIEELATQWEALADPPPPTQPFRAVITARHGRTLVAADGRHRWKIAAPDWAWETPEEDVARDPERYQRPPRWQPGDLVWLRMDEEDHVRLTQRTDLEAALLAVDLERGTALARVGGFDFRFGGFDRVGRARRQPGSALKPFLYATAIEYGWTPASIVIDAPVVFDNPEEGDFWRPENYARRFAGPVTLRNALEHSRNLASVRLLMDLGIQR
ncbi:MAG: penicillin-binding protein 1A, partial [Zetaproteobacteria bacterium]